MSNETTGRPRPVQADNVEARTKLSYEASARLAAVHAASTVDASGKTYRERMRDKAEEARARHSV